MDLNSPKPSSPCFVAKYKLKERCFNIEDFRTCNLDANDTIQILNFLPEQLKLIHFTSKTKKGLVSNGFNPGNSLFFIPLYFLLRKDEYLSLRNPFLPSTGLNYMIKVLINERKAILLLEFYESFPVSSIIKYERRIP